MTEEDRSAAGDTKVFNARQAADEYEATLVAVLRSQFDNQRAEVLRNLDSTRITKSYRKKDYLDDLADWDELTDALRLAVQPIIFQVLSDTGQRAMNDLGLEPGMFNPISTAILNYNQARASKIAQDVNDETEKQLRAALSRGVADGMATHKLAAVVEDIMGSASTIRADRIARTETSRAQGYGDIQAWSQSGVVKGKEFYTAEDEAVCPFCSDLDGKVIDLDDNFFDKGDVQAVQVDDGNGGTKEVNQSISYDDLPSPPLHVNCIAEDSQVVAPDAQRIMRSTYSGDLIRVRVAGGSVLTVTPNHPILTDRGFVAAKFIDKSYKLVRNVSADLLTGNVPDNNLRIPQIAEVFGAFHERFGVLSISVPVATEDFHGDGEAIQGNVDIVDADRLLMNKLESPVRKQLANFFFNRCRGHTLLSPDATLSQALNALAHSFDSRMSDSHLKATFARVSTLPDKAISLTSASDYETRICRSQHNGASRNAMALRNTFNGLAGLVALDNVTGVEVSAVHNVPVYDVETTSTMYTTDGYLVSNCRCTLLPVRG